MNREEFNKGEIKDRTEWLFWECFKQIDHKLDDLRAEFQIDDSQWSKTVRDQIFYETILWSFGQSIAVLRGIWNKKLTEEDIGDIVLDLIFFLEVMFLPKKDYEIMGIFSNYVVASQFEEDPKKLRDEIESYYFQRVCQFLKSDYHKLNQQEIKDFIFSKIPWGRILALKAFTEIPITDVKTANIESRQYFRKELIGANKRAGNGESAVDAQKRREWEKSVDEFNKIVDDASEALNDEINRETVTDSYPHSNTSNAMTSQELGEYLFDVCHRQTISFLNSLNASFQQKMIKIDREEINQLELLIAFMWLYYDLLQGEKYDKALTQMHTCFMNNMINLGLSEETWNLLQMRYDEYRQSHRDKDTIDFTYRKVAYEICKNILDLDTCTNIDLWTKVTIVLQQNILNIGKATKSIPLKDE